MKFILKLVGISLLLPLFLGLVFVIKFSNPKEYIGAGIIAALLPIILGVIAGISLLVGIGLAGLQRLFPRYSSDLGSAHLAFGVLLTYIICTAGVVTGFFGSIIRNYFNFSWP